MPNINAALPGRELARLSCIAGDQILTADPRSPVQCPESAISIHRRDIQFVPTIFAGYCDLMGFHRHLLDDTARTSAFLRAVEAVVHPGDVVLDLGTGTGILSLAACRAGASKVYAIEHSAIVQVAEKVAERNGYSDRIRFVKADSTRYEVPEQLDVIVSECVGLLGLGGTMIAAVSDMVRRGLKPGGRVVPRRIQVYAAPVASQSAHDYVHCWDRPRFGFDMASMRKLAANNVYLFSPKPEDIVSQRACLTEVDMLKDLPDGTFAARASFEIGRSTTIHGFCGWFDLELAQGVALSCGPEQVPTIWRQAFLPLPEAVIVEQDSLICLDLEICRGAGNVPIFIRWHTCIRDSSGAETVFSQSTADSFPT